MGELPGTLDADTLDPRPLVPAARPERAPVLTVALHPDPTRIGDRAVLALGTGGIELSRSDPSFLDGAGRSRGPLRDAHLSRAPVRLTRRGPGLVIDASGVKGVDLDGVELGGARELSLELLERGVVLGLAGVVLLVLRLARVTPLARQSYGLLGTSDEVDAIRAAIERSAAHSDSVLLLGESGTGKELVAQAIHRASARRVKPFVATNASTLAASMAAVELFGHSRGAFTGAEGAHDGLFGRADGGTLFLDEVGDLPEPVQPMLLRALETGEISPVGGRGARRIDVRVVAATDHDVHTRAELGTFRVPLLHRLASQTITLAPLRERREDVLPLFWSFVRAERPDEPAPSIELARRLLDSPWPGNVRELRNAARTLLREGPAALDPAPRSSPRAGAEPAVISGAGLPTDAEVVAALRKNQFRIAATARELGIAKNTLYKRMEACQGLRRARDLAEPEIRAAWAAHEGVAEAAAAALEVSERALVLRIRELGLDLGSGSSAG